jgi:hypothetical protein
MIYDDGMWVSNLQDEQFSVVLESGSFDALVERVKVAACDMLEVDFGYSGPVDFRFVAERRDIARAAA